MISRIKFSSVELTEGELESCAAEQTEWIYTQDTVNDKIVMAMGSRFTSISHLKSLLANVSKDVHHLVESDICPKDRQNFASLEKTMSDKVIDALEKNVADSQATVMFLRLTSSITSSYLDENIEPVKRIYKIWYALYFTQAWRKFICQDNNYKLKNNFITPNAYKCLEINAHSLVYSILKLRSMNKPQLFQPILFSSQPYESTFRHMRSLGTLKKMKMIVMTFKILNSSHWNVCSLVYV